MEAKCLECDATVKVENDAVIGEIITCPDCGADYEVAALNNGTVTNQGSRKREGRLG